MTKVQTKKRKQEVDRTIIRGKKKIRKRIKKRK